MTSGALLREARLRAGLTQSELAHRVGTTQPVIGRWERNEVQPSFERLQELVRACGLELSFSLTNYDDSYAEAIRARLAMPTRERVLAAVEHAHRAQKIRRSVVKA